MTLILGSVRFDIGDGPLGPETAFETKDGHIVACGTCCGDAIQPDFFAEDVTPPLLVLAAE